jgi:hypothetical protein
LTEHESAHHGLTTDGHGPGEHGPGAIESPDDLRDFAIEGRPESGPYPAFDRKKSFAQIGGSPSGAFIRAELDRRLHFGYPLKATPDQAAAHRIGAYYRVPIAVDAVKTALLVSPRNGGVVAGGPRYYSWFHPLISGRLPAPDDVAGGHAWWLRLGRRRAGLPRAQLLGPGLGPVGRLPPPLRPRRPDAQGVG